MSIDVILMIIHRFLIEECEAVEQTLVMQLEHLKVAKDASNLYPGYFHTLRARGCLVRCNHTRQLCASARRDVSNVTEIIKQVRRSHMREIRKHARKANRMLKNEKYAV
jgi:hypothetical protein